MTETGPTVPSAPARPESPPSPEVGSQDDIEIRLGASLTHLPIIRSIAANMAVRADFDMDAIADLRLAVDEACSTLVTRAAAESTMVCRFTVGDDELSFRGAVASVDESAPSTASFGWKVLTTLADAASTWVETGSENGQRNWVHVELTKRKPTIT